MNKTVGNQRLVRMLRECNVSAAPALLIAVACIVLVAVFGCGLVLR